MSEHRPTPPVITLTTDFGTQDSYVGAMKGVILTICPRAQVVDITHQIPPQDILRAGQIWRDIAPYYPEGTVHVAVVDPGVGMARRAILIEAHKQFFICPDNGLPGEVLRGVGDGARYWDVSHSPYALESRSSTFHGRDVFSPVAAHLAAGLSPGQMGRPLESVAPGALLGWRRTPRGLEGEVAHVDRFGNLVTSIPRQAWAGQLNLAVRVEGCPHLVVDRMVWTYGEAPDHQTPVALVGSSGYLEVAINQGSAGSKLDVEPGAKIWVDFLGGGGGA
jgi:S-adenosylmethionine hydrolase